MARPFKIEADERRPEIDFALANHCQLDAIAAHFDIDHRTLASYSRRIAADDPKHFRKLRVGTLSADDETILFAAKAFAAHFRRSLIDQAEAVFCLARP